MVLGVGCWVLGVILMVMVMVRLDIGSQLHLEVLGCAWIKDVIIGRRARQRTKCITAKQRLKNLARPQWWSGSINSISFYF